MDIGTRSIIGMLGKAVGDRFQVLAIDAEEHGKRAMLDGQIEDIDQVARVARVVTSRLEEKMGRRLTRVCVAAAGRALRTEQASFRLELPQVQRVDDALVSRLEAGAGAAGRGPGGAAVFFGGVHGPAVPAGSLSPFHAAGT